MPVSQLGYLGTGWEVGVKHLDAWPTPSIQEDVVMVKGPNTYDLRIREKEGRKKHFLKKNGQEFLNLMGKKSIQRIKNLSEPQAG